MKNLIAILSFIFIINCALAYEKVYLQEPSSSFSSSPFAKKSLLYNIPYRPTYNPYSNTKYNYNNLTKDRNTLRRIRLLRKIKYNSDNFLSWDILRNQKGNMTGYSTPINNDAYNLLDPNYGKKNTNNQNIKSPTTQTDIFVLPGNGNSSRDNKGNRSDDTGGIAGRTGVTIIYD